MDKAMEEAGRIFLQNLEVIDGIVRYTCARQRFRGEEADEFASHVRIKLLEDDYAVLRKFRGGCKLQTYLITVIQRIAIDYRIAQKGKWRPSRAADRLGPRAVELERLISRDRHSIEESVQILLHRDPGIRREELEALLDQLPSRKDSLRPHIVEWQDQQTDPRDQPAALADPSRIAEEIESAVRDVLKTMPEEDRILLGFRFEKDLPVPEMARVLNATPKSLYRRLDRLIERFRRMFRERRIESPARIEEACKRIRLFGPPEQEGKSEDMSVSLKRNRYE